MKKTSYWVIGTAISLLLLLIISNPTTNNLKNYAKLPKQDKVTINRENYFLFSLYTIDGTDGADFYQYKYVGVLWTFFGSLTMIT
ncbi:hypothetical protein GCM10027049_21330 [Mucilaginibacter puniceus]